MRKITKETLEELAKTMSIIPTFEQLCFVGEGGTTLDFSSVYGLINYLSGVYMPSNDYKEACFVFYTDGSCALYIDDSNTVDTSTITLQRSQSSGNWKFEGKEINCWGHTHLYSPFPSNTDLDYPSYEGLTRQIYYNGTFNNY